MTTHAVPTTRASSVNPLKLEISPDGVAIITYDVPGASMNTLRADFVDAFTDIQGEVEGNPDVRAAVLVSGKADSFIIGADVNMLSAIRSPDDGEAMCRRGHEALRKLAASTKPIVAAVHGQALGGGFEVALACHGRVLTTSKKTALGFPEVQLGLLPGLNGLQRLAAITGLQVALDHGLTGRNMRPHQALKLGVADDVVAEPILRDVAARLAIDLAERKHTPRPKRRRGMDALQQLALERNPLGRSLMFKKAREQARARSGGHYPALERIIDVIERYAQDGMEASAELEARAFGELVTGEVSRNLITIFVATTELKKDNGTARADVTPRTVEKVAVLGAGLMGAGIADVSIEAGIAVRMKDRDAESVARGQKYIAEILDEKLKKRRMTPEEHAETRARLSTAVDYSGLKRADLVIEAVFEDLGLKQRVLKDVEDAGRSGIIFASNTSSIPITRIAEAARFPENVVGMHYFSPVHKMPLLEVIRTAKTTDEVVATAVAVGKRQGKTVIVVNDGVGFYTSRVLGPYMNEASYMLTEGVPIETLDKAMTSFGWPVGPMTLIDEVGIDVAAHVGPIMLAAFGERMTPPPTVARLIADDRKGRKNGRGFYLYGDAAKKGKRADESVYGVLGLSVPSSSPLGIEEIQERCNLQFLNEAAHCLGEGILRCARDGDVGAIFGLGFPPFLGGPFRYLDRLGPAQVLRRIESYRDRFAGVRGDPAAASRWTPAPLIVEIARSGGRFHSQ